MNKKECLCGLLRMMWTSCNEQVDFEGSPVSDRETEVNMLLTSVSLNRCIFVLPHFNSLCGVTIIKDIMHIMNFVSIYSF